MLTVAAFLIFSILVVVACETTRGRFIRLLTDQDLRSAHLTVAPTTGMPTTKERDA